MTKREIAIVIEYNATRSVILLINEKLSGLFIEIFKRNPKSIPPVVVSSALSLTMVPYPRIKRSSSFSLSLSESDNRSSLLLHRMQHIRNKLDRIYLLSMLLFFTMLVMKKIVEEVTCP